MHCCKICNKEIPKKRFDSVKKYLTRIVCSRSCYKVYSNTTEMKEFYKQNRAKSKGNIGRVWTEEEKHKHSIALTGRKFSEEAKRNISDGHKGEKAYQWKGGISPIKELIRSSSKYKEWRKQILCRDRFACQICGHKSSNLQVDHIKPFSVIINELVEIFGIDNIREYSEKSVQLWDISNGRTLCVSCHQKTPLYMNIKSKYKDPLSTLFITVA